MRPEPEMVETSPTPLALELASDLFLFLEDRGQRVMLAPGGRHYHRAPVEVREGAKPNQDDYDYNRGRWNTER